MAVCATGSLTDDLSEWLHFGNENKIYQSSNNVSYIRLLLKHHDQFTYLGQMQETVSYLGLQDWYNMQSAIIFNIPSATDIVQNSPRVSHLHLWLLK